MAGKALAMFDLSSIDSRGSLYILQILYASLVDVYMSYKECEYIGLS